MAALITNDFNLPEEYVTGVFKKAQSTSALARLSGAQPQKFGKSNVMTLTSAPKAELVAEGNGGDVLLFMCLVRRVFSNEHLLRKSEHLAEETAGIRVWAHSLQYSGTVTH